LERRIARLDRSTRRSASALVFAALLIAGAILRADDAVLGGILMAGSVVPLLHGLWAGRRGL
ncbi:MAG: ABC transporter, partial [Arthrobacter sp.]|nr:ABC transporter [Arthrobacter sp.]